VELTGVTCYDDGFVFVDSSGNAGGFTWFWGYQNASQIQGDFLVFHGRTNLGPNTLQIITDRYDVGFLVLPPPPYAGSFAGPGPIISDIPVSRSTTTVVIPTLSFEATATNALIISWPSFDGWVLEQSSDFNTVGWTEVIAAADHHGTSKSVTISPLLGNRFYRLSKLLDP
jgi:hypothetical protein